jgi:hypothetical protein
MGTRLRQRVTIGRMKVFLSKPHHLADSPKVTNVPVVEHLEAGTMDELYDDLFNRAIEDCTCFAGYFIK